MAENAVAPRTRRRGRPPKISRAVVVERALEIGFAELTFAELARRLEVSETTLYQHVPDRASLVQAAMNHLYERVEPIRPRDSWRARLEAEADALWAMLASDPALVVEAASGPVAPASVAYFNRVARPLIAAGFDPANALLAADTVFDLVHDVFVRSQHLEADLASTTDAESWFRVLDPSLQAATTAALGDPERWFRRKLALVLDGITVDRQEQP